MKCSSEEQLKSQNKLKQTEIKILKRKKKGREVKVKIYHEHKIDGARVIDEGLQCHLFLTAATLPRIRSTTSGKPRSASGTCTDVE